MHILIEDLLIFSRITTRAQPFVPINLAKVTKEVLSDLEVLIQQTGGRVEVGELPVKLLHRNGNQLRIPLVPLFVKLRWKITVLVLTKSIAIAFSNFFKGCMVAANTKAQAWF